MPIVAVTNQKGGVGKTTVATNLAIAFALDGRRTLLVDADPQASAVSWKADRPETGVVTVATIALPAPNLHKELPAFGADYDVVIVDAGGRITATARSAAVTADFVVIPLKPHKLDIQSTRTFLDTVVAEVSALRPGLRVGLLVTDVFHTAMSRAAIGAISDMGCPVFDAQLYHRTAYQEALHLGLGVLEHEPGSQAATEVTALYREFTGALQP